MAVRDAEAQLRAADFKSAANMLRKFQATVISDYETPSEAAVRRRGERLLARTVIASGGRARPYKPGFNTEARARNLVWAGQRLEKLLEHDLDNPQIKTDLGVALSKLEEKHDEARRVLEALAKRDLMTSAAGWAALASLREATEGRTDAVRRCRLMALRPDEECPSSARTSSAGTKKGKSLDPDDRT